MSGDLELPAAGWAVWRQHATTADDLGTATGSEPLAEALIVEDMITWRDHDAMVFGKVLAAAHTVIRQFGLRFLMLP